MWLLDFDITVNESASRSEKSRGGTHCDLQHQANVMNATMFMSFYIIYAQQAEWGATTQLSEITTIHKEDAV